MGDGGAARDAAAAAAARRARPRAGARPDGRLLSVRERMEEHRASPACSSCHRVIDPLGLALEHFDVTGHYRIKDSGQPIDASGELYDGTKIDGLSGLRDALLKRKDIVLQTFTENLMTYALGRRIEAADMPTVRAIVRAAAKQDYRIVGVHHGGDREPRVSDARRSSDRETYRQGDRRGTLGFALDGATDGWRGRRRAMFISKKHISRRTVLRGMGATIALPLLDAMVPAGVALAQTAAAQQDAAGVHRDRCTARPGRPRSARAKHLWSPAANGRAFDLSPTAMSALEPYRDYLTIISNTTRAMAEALDLPEIGGDHFRSSAVFLTQAHPKQTQGSDVRGRAVSLDQILRAALRPGHADSVDATVHREHRSGRQLRLRLRLRLHGHRSAGRRRPSRCRWCAIRAPCSISCSASAARRQQRSAQRKADRSILDWVSDEFARLRPQLMPVGSRAVERLPGRHPRDRAPYSDHRGAQHAAATCASCPKRRRACRTISRSTSS